ncbi:hypothetical protein U1Q18_014708, partial [Sarracenia purpurea var. burkii]
MGTEDDEEIYVVPFFGQGHLLPSMELYKHLASRNYKTTFIISSSVPSSLQLPSSSPPPSPPPSATMPGFVSLSKLKLTAEFALLRLHYQNPNICAAWNT